MKFLSDILFRVGGSWRLCGRFLRLYLYDFEGGISGYSTWWGLLTIELKRRSSAVATMSCRGGWNLVGRQIAPLD